MSREIKFRAWDSYLKIMGEVCFMNDTGADTWEVDYLGNPGEPKTGLIIDQYTGLKDKNGVEIYEGDVCNCPDTGVDGTIVFHNGRFAWTDGACHWDMVYNAKDGQPKDTVATEADDLIVIGNIHQDAELLK